MAKRANWAMGFTILVSLLAIAASLFEYLETARRESQKPFLERQLDLYFEASRVAAKIATSEPDSAADKEAQLQFWELYWGELAAVEDAAVESAMIEFGNALKVNTPRDVLKGKAINIACKCRKSIQESWGYELGELSKSCKSRGSPSDQ